MSGDAGKFWVRHYGVFNLFNGFFFVRWKRGESWFINWFGWLYSGHKCLIWFKSSTQDQQSFWSQNPKLNQLGLV